jgi:hypothetical protein
MTDPKEKKDPSETSEKKYSMKDTTILSLYILKGSPVGINNYDEFSWWFKAHFQELGL